MASLYTYCYSLLFGKEEEPTKRMRRLVTTTVALVAIEEVFIAVGVISYPVSIDLSGYALSASMILLVLLLPIGMSRARPASRSVGFNLVSKTSEPHLTWFYLHSIYWTVAIFNVLIIFLALTVYVVYSTKVGLILTVSIAVGFAQFFTYLLLNVLGQRYEGIRGDSFLGAGAYADLSIRMFKERNREGLLYLLNALSMSASLFNRRSHYPSRMDEVYTTVESLIDVEENDIPYTKLTELAESLQLLPKRDGLPKAFDTFLKDLDWPSGFKPKPVNHQQALGTRLITSLFAALTATSSIVLIFQSEMHQMLISFSGLILSNFAGFIGDLAIIIGIIAVLWAARYNVPLSTIRKYWRVKRQSEEKAVTEEQKQSK